MTTTSSPTGPTPLLAGCFGGIGIGRCGNLDRQRGSCDALPTHPTLEATVGALDDQHVMLMGFVKLRADHLENRMPAFGTFRRFRRLWRSIFVLIGRRLVFWADG